jgi:hypothetical protein
LSTFDDGLQGVQRSVAFFQKEATDFGEVESEAFGGREEEGSFLKLRISSSTTTPSPTPIVALILIVQLIVVYRSTIFRSPINQGHIVSEQRSPEPLPILHVTSIEDNP